MCVFRPRHYHDTVLLLNFFKKKTTRTQVGRNKINHSLREVRKTLGEEKRSALYLKPISTRGGEKVSTRTLSPDLENGSRDPKEDLETLSPEEKDPRGRRS